MSTLDKKSIRTELDRIKTDFESLSSSGKLSGEALTLCSAMLMMLQLLSAIFMEKLTKKNSVNSSIPPSQTEPDQSAISQKMTNGKGKLENTEMASNTVSIETVQVSQLDYCALCGANLRTVRCDHHERRTKIDIVYQKVITHTDAEIKNCPKCGETTKALFPPDLHGPLQYGNGLAAFIVNVIVSHAMTLQRTQKLVMALIGTHLAEATILKFIERVHEKLAPWEEAAKIKLLSATTLHVDETSLKVNQKNFWIHTHSSGDTTLKLLHERRGLEAIKKFDLIPRYSGILIHDCWASYLSYKNCDHGLCGSHLLRELTHAIESNGYHAFVRMKELLSKTCAKVSRLKRKKLSENAYRLLKNEYRHILRLGIKELPKIPDKPSGKPGKIAKSDAHNLWDRLKKYQQFVLHFARNPDVAFTNNRAERDLRPSKTKQKVSGCFRTEQGAKAYCRISSYLQSMSSRGYNPLIAIQMALSGQVLLD